MMRKLFAFLLPVLLLAGSCTERMDPFEGSDGVRANINGYKCVMDGNRGQKYVYWSTDGTPTVDITVNMVKQIDNQPFKLEFHVTDNTAITVGTTYHFSGASLYAKLSSPPGAPGEEVNMNGWIRFLQLKADSNIVEAEFELDGTAQRSDEKYEVRHGFLRLYK